MIPEAHKQLQESEEYINEFIIPLTILASKMIYSRYFSKEAKQCVGKSGFIRSKCLTKARMKGIAAQIKEFEASKSKCGKSEARQKCLDQIEKRIGMLKSKMHKLSIKMIGYNYRQSKKTASRKSK